MTIPPDQGARERAVLDWLEVLLDAPDQKQRADFDALALSDPELHERVLTLLKTDRDAPNILPTGGALHLPGSERQPESIGRYRILRELGRGGMGTVYLGAPKTDEFDLKVAIKVVRRSANTERLVERLREERRTMTLLKHPNIALMLDGGETDEGYPYLVMEYVDGIPLNQYLEQQAMSQQQRLELFLQICSATAYSHQNLVIHRDLSPSNILVMDDQTVKLVDFGLAHNLDKDDVQVGQSSYLTITEGYGAPERALGENATTKTDIYSLGAILLDLCSDQSFPRAQDLLAIAATASSVDPSERYPSVDALVADIHAYQEIRPVSVCSADLKYRAVRFLRRYRSPVLMFASVFVGMIVGSIVLGSLYLRALDAERQADSRFNQVRKIATLLMFDVQDSVAELDGSLSAQQLLVETALTYLEDLGATASTPDLLLEIAQGYKRLGDVTGNPNYINLGRRDLASDLLQRAVDTIQSPILQGRSDPKYLRAYSDIIGSQVTQIAFSEGDFERAYRLLLTAQKVTSQLAMANTVTLEDQIAGARQQSLLGYLSFYLDDLPQAIEHAEQGVSAFRQLHQTHGQNSKVARMYFASQSSQAELLSWSAYQSDQDYSLALERFDAAIAGMQSLVAARVSSKELRKVHWIAVRKRAHTMCSTDERRAEGVADMYQSAAAVTLALETAANDQWMQNHLANVKAQLAECLYLDRQVKASIAVWEEVVSLDELRLQAEPGNPGYLKGLVNDLYNLSTVYMETADLENACRIARQQKEVLDTYRQPEVTVSDLDQKAGDYNAQLLAKCS
ncbi:MAG: serine/threonine-protein kinase [Pseudomonadales bacterium]